ncbi:hypothetical protein [Lonsdalea quercina]|uniref:hypothetical protein n=1 Tax=Lonsdalea quercina TaxID=71657 RepID=UPI003F48DBAB
MKKNRFQLVVILSLLFQPIAWANDIHQNLEEYGERLSETSEKRAIEFIKVYQTTDKPMNAYRMDFNTAEKSLLSVLNAENDETAKLQNLIITKGWEIKFCQPELIRIMRKNDIDMVSGFLINKGETQRIAVCFKSMQ